MALHLLRNLGTFAKRVLALEPTIREMRESVTGHPSGIFRPVPTPWYATEVVLCEHRDYPVEVNCDIEQLPACLGDGDDGVTPPSLEDSEGMSVPIRRNLCFRGDRTAGLEEGVVAFSGEFQRDDVGDQYRMF